MRHVYPIQRRTPIAGFTLVELLVVIAIIAVLVGILLPSLSKARQAAQQVVCMNNMRQLGTAFVQYTISYNRYPNFRWPEALAPYLGGTLLGSTELPDVFDNIPRVQPLNLIHCPSVPAEGIGGQPITLTYAINGVSAMGWWAQLTVTANLWSDDGPAGANNKLPWVNPSKVVHPWEFGLLTEMWKTDGPQQSTWGTTWWRLAVSNEFSCLFTHGGGKATNVLFADGHVASLTWNATDIDANTGYRKIQDQDDSLFNYDGGSMRYGTLTASKYLQ